MTNFFLVMLALGATKNVATAAELQAAISSAVANDEMVLADGRYDFTASPSCNASGTAALPITVRAANRLKARIRFNTVEGFKVNGPYWRFDRLDVVGICPVDSDCEHAFHVSGRATGFQLLRSRIADFNAQLKVNASPAADGGYDIPNQGLIEGNELFDSHTRNTGNPTTKLNIDTGDDWVIRGNFIHDFHKGLPDNVSYACS